MTRRLILAATAVALIGGGALPALADGSSTDTERICVALSSDSGKEPVAPLCVWFPTR